MINGLHHPKLTELLISETGLIFDTAQNKQININVNPGGAKAVMASWTTNGKTYPLDVIKLVYETHIEKAEIHKKYTIRFKEGTEVRVDNLKKVAKWTKEYPTMRPTERFETFNGDEIYC